MLNSSVVILLASYNGSKYINEQIASIQAQSYQDWQLIVRDDCSTDETVSIVEEMAKKDDRISLIEHDNVNLGVIGNFGTLMDTALNLQAAKYIFFADQDDVWKPDKLQIMLTRFDELERIYGSEKPILLHSDLEVVDQHLVTINDSFMKYQAINHEKINAWQVLAVQNFVTGCAMAINRPLLQRSLPLPKNIVMHDWWIALCASTVGYLEFINKPLIEYRQHDMNEVGAKGFWKLLSPFHTDLRKRWREGALHFKMAVEQIGTLIDRVGDDIKNTEDMIVALKMFSMILEMPRLQRIKIIWKCNFHRQNKSTNIIVYFRVLTF